MVDVSKVGKRGTVMIPAPLRRRFGIEEGSLIVAEATEEGILIRPAIAFPVEVYIPQRRVEFMLSNAVNADDYVWAVEEVRRMGLYSEAVPHLKPA